LAEIGVEGRDVWAICGTDVLQVKDAETCRQLAEEARPAPANRLHSTLFQIRAIRRLAIPGTTVIAFTPFYGWPVLRAVSPGLRLVHVEQSKGGRHHELASHRGGFGFKERAVGAAVAMNFLFPHKIVFPSRGAAALFAQKNPRLAGAVTRKGMVIYNGVEGGGPGREKPLPGDGPFRILSVCEDVPEKALSDCLGVVALLVGAGAKIAWHHFGSVRDSTRHFAEDQQLPVVFHGTCPRVEVLAAMREADVFLHLPRVAVFDLSVIEAMAASLPVVATPVGGNLEALGDGSPHFAGNPESAAVQIQKMIESPESAARAGQELRARAEANFTAAAMATRYLLRPRGILNDGF
jgi:glycosyltransferase involved in cell wall biosynthesis